MSERIVGKKTDNNRKKSKFSLALAAELIQRAEQYQTPSSVPCRSTHQSVSMVGLEKSILVRFLLWAFFDVLYHDTSYMFSPL